MNSARQQKLRDLIRNVPDFPKPGIQFKDITPLLDSPKGFALAIEAMVDACPRDIDAVAGIESRGFIFGAPMALAMGTGFVPIRKPGKLPYHVYEESFELEYGESVLNMHVDALREGERVLLVDDLLATGGSLVAAKHLVERAGAVVVHVAVLIELLELGGRARLTEQGVTNFSSALQL